jgi:hypothetical protein
VTVCFWFCFAYLVGLLMIKMVIASLIGKLIIWNVIRFTYFDFHKKHLFFQKKKLGLSEKLYFDFHKINTWIF